MNNGDGMMGVEKLGNRRQMLIYDNSDSYL